MRLLKLSHFYGRQNTKYLSRLYLPRGYKLHIFARGDEDRDPHDHPWDFWTFPLTSYYEEYLEPDRERLVYVTKVRLVRAWRWHHRSAEHIHRVLGKQPYYAPGVPQRIITLVKTAARRRQWGFWMEDEGARYKRSWVSWREYLGVPPDTPEDE